MGKTNIADTTTGDTIAMPNLQCSQNNLGHWDHSFLRGETESSTSWDPVKLDWLTLFLTAQVIYDLAFSMENYSKKF